MAQVETIACPLCSNAASFLPVRVPAQDEHIHGYGALYDGMAVSEWKICGRCGFVHQNPRPSVEALNRFYLEGNYHTKIDVPPAELFANHGPYYQDEVEYAIAHAGVSTGSVFDIGCGLGVALKLFKDRGWDCYGIEPDRGRFEYGRDHYGLTNIVQGALDASFELGRKVDLVFTHHAFEHFADLPAVMTAITKLLKPGGFLFTAIPTFRDNKSTMSKLWMNSAHYSLFTDRSFNQLLARHGFEEIDHRYNPWKAGPDQLGHIARFTGTPSAPERFYEDPAAVSRYLNVVNPLRSAVYLPLRGGYRGYRHHLQHAAKLARAAGHVLVTQPNQFFAKTAAYLRRK
jgi:SAM-dependent methyltransferase